MTPELLYDFTYEVIEVMKHQTISQPLVPYSPWIPRSNTPMTSATQAGPSSLTPFLAPIMSKSTTCSSPLLSVYVPMLRYATLRCS